MLRLSYGLIFLFSFTMHTYSQPFKHLHFNRSVLLKGFHRILHYKIIFPNVRGPTQILVDDTLPKDIYLDPYQLSKEIEDKEIKIITDKMINSEIPAYQAQSFDIQLCSVSQTNSHEIELPIHLRYQKPHNCNLYGKSVGINLEDALVHIKTFSEGFPNTRCFNMENDDSWIENMVTVKTSFQVPVGCVEDFYMIFGLTMSVVVAAALYIACMLIQLNKKM